jgi:glycine/sarcosine N-methyltransferase
MCNHQTEKFYENIAEKYHWFFSSWDEVMKRQMQELVPLLKKYKVKTILDCSCGTGLQTIGLAKEGFSVVGSDLSDKMLDIARRNTEKEGVTGIVFIKSDFGEIRSKFDGTFDAVISFGNSIPHLHSNSEILKAFKNIYDCLKNGGIAIFDIRNYDDLLIKKPKFLPMRIHAEKDGNIVSILYVFDYLQNLVRFNVVYLIEEKSSGHKSIEVEIIDYNPIKSEVFVNLLKEVGFISIEKKEMGPNLHFIAFKSSDVP